MAELFQSYDWKTTRCCGMHYGFSVHTSKGFPLARKTIDRLSLYIDKIERDLEEFSASKNLRWPEAGLEEAVIYLRTSSRVQIPQEFKPLIPKTLEELYRAE